MMDRTSEELSRLSNLIGLIYEGATDPGRWTQSILPALANYIEAPACILYSFFHTPQTGGYFFLYGIEQEHVDLYVQKYYAADVWKISLHEKNLSSTGNVILGEEVVPRAQLLASDFYKECLAHSKNMAQLLTGIVFGTESTTSVPGACSFFRGLHHPDFDEENRARMHLILPHLSRSLGVMQRLQSAELTVATSLAALDRLPSGVLLLNSSGSVTFANRAAQYMLKEGDGLRLHKSGRANGLGNLVAESASDSSAISEAIRATFIRDPYATEHFSQSVKVPRTSGLAPYALQFSALGDHNEFSNGSDAYAAIVFIADGAKAIHVDPEALQSAYGLTPTEARVAITVLEYVSAKDVANILGVSHHTVRTQIKNIYAKLGVDTRTRFVKLMLGLASQRTCVA